MKFRKNKKLVLLLVFSLFSPLLSPFLSPIAAILLIVLFIPVSVVLMLVKRMFGLSTDSMPNASVQHGESLEGFGSFLVYLFTAGFVLGYILTSALFFSLVKGLGVRQKAVYLIFLFSVNIIWWLIFMYFFRH